MNAMVLNDILSELKEIRRILHDSLESDKRNGKGDTDISVATTDIAWDKVEPYNPLNGKTKDELESGSKLLPPSCKTPSNGYVYHANCPNNRQSSCGCEYLGVNGTCNAVCYLTYPPQFDKCPFCI